jgi:crotonobetainyl-CoA:carnitine CoA-transferase CaiB-like acyl-CoA transferase
MSWPEHYNRSGYFNKLNRNKRAICLDLARPEGKDVFLKLVAKADAVIENNAARVMGNLGLDYERLRAVNPGIVMCSMSGFGSTGPERNYSAFGSNIETSSGLASVLGYGDGTFYGTGTFYADPVTGNHGSVAVLAALHARRRSGRGQWVDMSLLEAVGPFFAGQLLQYTVQGVVPEPSGNRSDRCAPQGAYPTAGRDCWLALSVRDEVDYRALCAVIGFEPRPAELAPGGVAARRERADEIDAAIRQWAAPLDHIRAADLLQAAGVPAAPVMPAWEIFGDNHLNDRAFFERVRQPSTGTWWFAGFPWRLEKTPARTRLPAPMFAEHNRAVFRDLLGLSEAEVEGLYASGITADEPQFAAGSL